MTKPPNASNFTIVIPTIARWTLQRSIDSARAQTVPCELVIEHDPDRTGCGPTLNRALTRVRTEWFGPVADDDVLMPSFAERTLEHADTADMVIFQMQHPAYGVLPMTTDPQELCFGQVGGTFAMRTQLAKEIGYMNGHSGHNGALAEDWEMVSKVRAGGFRIIIVPEVMFLVSP
jgi:hypothetical protein